MLVILIFDMAINDNGFMLICVEPVLKFRLNLFSWVSVIISAEKYQYLQYWYSYRSKKYRYRQYRQKPLSVEPFYYVVLALSRELFNYLSVCSLMRCVIGFAINENIITKISVNLWSVTLMECDPLH